MRVLSQMGRGVSRRGGRHRSVRVEDLLPLALLLLLGDEPFLSQLVEPAELLVERHVVEVARGARVRIGFLEYCRVGVPLTLVTLLLGWLFLALVPV
jgi:hypothetical protein